MPMSRTYILMVTLHFAVVLASGIFLWMGRYLGKLLISLVTELRNLRADMAPYKIMAHLTFEDLCTRRPEMRGVLDAMTAEATKVRKQQTDGLEVG